ncbi:MAG: hypothetical protein GEV10_03950 [Streptosporangiales bacterium]|nr:hypothetical protein [Streptosporangiales bacterium]
MPDPLDDKQVRTGFNRLAVAVAIVSTFDGDEPHGSTGMAWAEHVDPPLVLTTLRRAGASRRLVEATGMFGVSVLDEGQDEYVRRFAAKSHRPGDRFDGVPYAPGPRLGLPLLDGCVATFECEVKDIHPFGGHDIVVGEAVSATASGDQRALVHYDGHLWALRRDAQ